MRYTDDLFFVWNHGENKLDEFFECLNSFYPNLKFTSEGSEQKNKFYWCYSNKKLSKNKCVTDLCYKPTDCHQYLHYDACHPEHMKKLSIYSQGLHIKRLCS